MISMCDNLEKWILKFVWILFMIFLNEDFWFFIWCDIFYFCFLDIFVVEIIFFVDYDKLILKFDLFKKKKILGKKIIWLKFFIKLFIIMWILFIFLFKYLIKVVWFN